MNNTTAYDVGIAGGGLAGLSLSILCAKAGYRVLLVEKETYPFNKVCGEYISLESWDFMKALGLPLNEMQLPLIKKLQVSAPGGTMLEQKMPLGGFGISRYKLDAMLASIAKNNGVVILENTRVQDISYENDALQLQINNQSISCKTAAGAFGKRSNLDIQWKRSFVLRKARGLDNYIGIKYHVRLPHPPDTIALHNFSHGYCGLSKVEDDKYCLCYLARAADLKRNGNDIREMEKRLLQRNPFLEKIFSSAEFLSSTPVTIAQVSFAAKTQVENHVLLTGDAAGMITPLCGNGMSMAMHGAKIAFKQIDAFLQGKISRESMEKNYTRLWKAEFSGRLRMGRRLQRFFGHAFLSNLLIRCMKPFPFLLRALIRRTHGESF